jgi:hypothetical protein
MTTGAQIFIIGTWRLFNACVRYCCDDGSIEYEYCIPESLL